MTAALKCNCCGNRLSRVIRCTLCAADTAGKYLRAKYREGNVIQANSFCQQCVDGARLEIDLQIGEDDHDAIVRYLTRKMFDKAMERADQMVMESRLQEGAAPATKFPLLKDSGK